MARHGYYDEQYGFVPYDDCSQDNLYSESEAKHTFSPSEPKTNADRIRAMTDEELAEYLFERGNGDEYCYGICVHQDDINACVKTLKQNGCIQSVVAWLKQEAES